MDQGPAWLGNVQFSHGTGAGGELSLWDTHTLHQVNKQVRQRIVVVSIEGQVLSVFQSTTRNEHRHVGGSVLVGISKIATVHNYRIFQQIAFHLLSTL